MNLAARLRGGAEGESAYAVAVLLARHWQAAYDYAVICLAAEAERDLAATVATSAFYRVLGVLERGGSNRALRPQLLVSVGETVREWSAGDGVSARFPELREPVGARGPRGEKARASERRQLAERSFGALPRAAQCLLWHTEVEAEPLRVPARLVGVDAASASAALEQARDQFWASCVQAHRELAPTDECRSYSRLLDVLIRRGGALLPDVRQHLSTCPHCRCTADQLGRSRSELGTVLAEAVLGRGARRYLYSRPGRGGRGSFLRDQAVQDGGRTGGVGRHRVGARLPWPGGRSAGPWRRGRAVAVGVGVISFALLASVLGARGWSDGNTVPAATWGEASGYSAGLAPASPGSAGPGPAFPPRADGSAPAAPAGRSRVAERGRLRHVATGLCLDVRGERVVAGAGTRLAVCSSAGAQRWSYEYDGLLRSVADPSLCLDSRADDGNVALSGCVRAYADGVRYDLTVRGELLPHGGGELAVVPASLRAGADVVVRTRSGVAGEIWVFASDQSVSGGARAE
ncbi:RICIN domain-containing protein [Streptomyces sp. NBC_01451]|uniref:RICIN domain-containing protein n=1 Tax=Streptomyces sp. NBC_01451 TaxID=2903872 RepID=UPI002E36564D|nr:RICIN domain-containing protein [Streptomyces sp. NBC_01451]